MNPDIFRLAQGEIGLPVVVGRVRETHAGRYGARSRHVYISRQTLLKQLSRRPEISLDFYIDLDWLLLEGEFIRNRRPDCFYVVSRKTQVTQRHRWKATLKVVAGNGRILMLSLHKVRDRDVRALSSRWKG